MMSLRLEFASPNRDQELELSGLSLIKTNEFLINLSYIFNKQSKMKDFE